MRFIDKIGIGSSIRSIVVTGSGGKSSLCHRLAKEYLEMGKSCVITTTTHLSAFLSEDCILVLPEDIGLRVPNGKLPVCAVQGGEEKLKYPGDETFNQLFELFDVVITEADGSRMLPLKYPNNYEPVLPEKTDCIITVCGLSCLDKPISDTCHRYELAQSKIQITDSLVNEEMVATVLYHGYGYLQPVFFLNQADTDDLSQRGENIKKILTGMGAEKVIVGSLMNDGYALPNNKIIMRKRSS